MSATQKLEIKQGATLVMTPQLQEAIKLLQMAHADVSAFVAQEIEKNPLLDLNETQPENELRLDLKSGDQAPSESQKEEKKDDPWDDQDDEKEGRPASDYVHDDFIRDRLSAPPSLHEHLIRQIRMEFPLQEERRVVLDFLNHMDDAGYLRLEPLPFCHKWKLSESALDQLIRRAQQLEPAGILARNLAECLSAQLMDMDLMDELMSFIVTHLDWVAERNFKKLCAASGTSEKDIIDKIALLKKLSPRPADQYAVTTTQFVVPDVFVYQKKDGAWIVELNQEVLPRLIANEQYYTTLSLQTKDKDTQKYAAHHWHRAKWLIKALDQRAQTLLRVTQEIVRAQNDFFIHGTQFLRPLSLKTIAEATQLHESTISRVTQNKNMATPLGVFPLKHFFSAALSSLSGTDDVASSAVRARIKEIIDKEDKARPLSDQKIGAVLKYEGIAVARRTIAKYRESLSIPPSTARQPPLFRAS